MLAKPLQVVVLDIDAINFDASRGRIVESLQQLEASWLSTAGLANKGNSRARCSLERNSLQDLLFRSWGVGEVHILKLDISGEISRLGAFVGTSVDCWLKSSLLRIYSNQNKPGDQ